MSTCATGSFPLRPTHRVSSHGRHHAMSIRQILLHNIAKPADIFTKKTPDAAGGGWQRLLRPALRRRSSNPLAYCAELGKFFHEPFVAAQNMLDAVDDGLAPGGHPATISVAPMRKSVAVTGAPVNASTPSMTAVWPSVSTLPPNRLSSSTWPNRSSKMRSLMTLVLSANNKKADNCGCKSVGKPG